MALRRAFHPPGQPVATLPVLLGLTCLLGNGCGSEAPTPQPSIVLISIDTLRADHTGFHGYERDTTPTLDQLAEESLVFENAFAPAPWTLVSHMTMLTGLYPNQHGVVDGDFSLAPETPTLAERLAARGYQTIGLYYEGWIHRRHGFDRGFQTFRAHKNAEEAGKHLAEELERLDLGRPHFLFLHLFDVHSGPLDAHAPGPIYDCPSPYNELWMKDAAARLPQIREGELWLSKEPLSPEALAALTALYDGGIRYVDDKLGLWFDDLRARGLFQDSLLIVTADHGESLGQRGKGIRDHGGGYQDGLHVPLLVRLPGGARGGERIAAPVHLADVVPTVLALAGLADERLPGVDLAGAVPSQRLLYGWSPDAFELVVEWPRKHMRVVKTDRYLTADLERSSDETQVDALDADGFATWRERFLETVQPFPPAAPVLVEDEAALRALQEELNKMGYGGEEH